MRFGEERVEFKDVLPAAPIGDAVASPHFCQLSGASTPFRRMRSPLISSVSPSASDYRDGSAS
ncbi:hypothetical protein EMEDMD4_570236 [Sinorhizobium medicae]|uniref:Uncharacterized protein n=1 Tax=Sinorhizobium medicae TaxID=110321 RepID=A0A508X453_9HYPH|nr:hypothetical protein EMEDMD4_570236 [Sinorhizobium medicae]